MFCVSVNVTKVQAVLCDASYVFCISTLLKYRRLCAKLQICTVLVSLIGTDIQAIYAILCMFYVSLNVTKVQVSFAKKECMFCVSLSEIKNR